MVSQDRTSADECCNETKAPHGNDAWQGEFRKREGRGGAKRLCKSTPRDDAG